MAPAPAPTGTPAALGGVALSSLTGLRPLVRPQALTPVAAVPVLTGFSGPRPTRRPDGLAPASALPPAEAPQVPAALPDLPVSPTVPDLTTPDLTAALVAIVASAPDPLAGASVLAVAQARRPDARPRNFDRVVARTQDRQARAQPAAAPGSLGTANLQPEEQAEDDPVEVATATLAPNGPIPGGVAEAATFENVLALRDINLIGVYGRPDDRRALVRLANGRYLRVSVGDSLDGGQVSAIGDAALNYVKRGRTITLEMPGG